MLQTTDNTTIQKTSRIVSGVKPLHAILAIGGLALFAAGAWWVIDHLGVVITSDARVRARMVTLSSEVAGRIVELPVAAGDRVTAGAVIARLDDREARLALDAMSLDLDALEAQIAREELRSRQAAARGKSRIDGSRSMLAVSESDFTTARARLRAREADHARTLALKASGLITQAAMDRALADLEAARQTVVSAEAAVGRSRAGIGEAEAEAGEAQVIAGSIDALMIAREALRQRLAAQELTLERHTIVSPLDGVIDEVFADPGEHIAAGARIALAHAPDDMWIEANIKETDLAGMHVGASVDIHMDASAGACVGRVERIGDAATSEFALIPNANPTGVFTKITQRIPVRVAIGATCREVRPGAMATLRISTAR